MPSSPTLSSSRPEQRMLCIDSVSEMAPFLMTMVSDADLWMYVSSAGGLTCGRREAERCLFPYETDDRLHTATGRIGPVTYLRIETDGAAPTEWRPMAHRQAPGTVRNLYKTELSHQIVFEEINEALGLTFRYRWASARNRGFIRTSELVRSGGSKGTMRIGVLDGLLGIMPAGVALATQQRASALVNAYRHTELDPLTGRLAMYRLTAIMVDRAEAAEALTCNAVWSVGLPGASVLLSEAQVDNVRAGGQAHDETELAGRPASYLLASTIELQPGDTESWDIVADVALSQADVVARRRWPRQPDIRTALCNDIQRDGRALGLRLARADGLQRTGNERNDAHHLANVLFNCMRGGVCVDDYLAPSADLRRFINARNHEVATRNEAFLGALPQVQDCLELVRQARAHGDPDLVRLTLEYLPISFSRRHGDPSRPWNAFDIRVDDKNGDPRLYYQGNWRDIFQNWEALAMSFPGFLPQMVAKFVNASTADGFNPYRVTSEGIDWEIPDKDDPWSNIGYWGDHQIVYLTRLLEQCESFWPGRLTDWLSEPVFGFADVPYRLRPYQDLITDPRASIRFDHERQQSVLRRVEKIGADGRLLVGENGQPLHVTLAEKLLVPVLTKICSLVLDGGIWMNSQRPEWNDANNALAGYGLSMVTLYQLRRHLKLCIQLFDSRAETTIVLTSEVSAWLDRVLNILQDSLPLLETPRVKDTDRRHMLDALGEAFGAYRAQLYSEGLHPGPTRALSELSAVLETALPFLDHAIRANQRADGLYEAYNLLHAEPDTTTARISRLYEMLEGQVAVLGAGVLDAEEAIRVLDALFASKMYRADQRSFLLYPDRRLPGFLEKNIIAANDFEANALLCALLKDGVRGVVVKDEEGHYRFASHLKNEADLNEVLDTLALDSQWTERITAHRTQTLDTWETVFNHHSFTGRSGSMYGYEGLGCIYWHMVSKLLVAVQENLHAAIANNASAESIETLKRYYRRVRKGLSSAKTPQEYGAFPTDPYSHTAKHAGAQQPGMTGQVKEEIVTRFRELGVEIRAGKVHFGRGLLTPEDFLAVPTAAQIPGETGPVTLEAGTLAFTLAETPVIYRHDPKASEVSVAVTDRDGLVHPQSGPELDEAWSRSVFLRDHRIARIDLRFPLMRG